MAKQGAIDSTICPRCGGLTDRAYLDCKACRAARRGLTPTERSADRARLGALFAPPAKHVDRQPIDVRPWTDEEDGIVLANRELSNADLAARLGRTAGEVHRRRIVLARSEPRLDRPPRS